jgi:O-antigen/teichoic acid export membrane protein
MSIAVACLLFFSATWLSIDIFHEPGLIPILQIFSIAVPFWVLAQIFLPATVGFQDVKYKIYTEDIFHNLFKLVVIGVFLYFGFGVIGATFGWLLSIIAMAVMAFYYLEKKVFPLVNTKIKSVSTMGELLSFSIPLIFATAAGLLLGYTDTLMLGYFYNADATKLGCTMPHYQQQG